KAAGTQITHSQIGEVVTKNNGTFLHETRYRNDRAVHKASLVPAAAVIPAPIAYIKVAAVKPLVVGLRMSTTVVLSRSRSVARHLFDQDCPGCSSVSVLGDLKVYFEKMRALKASPRRPIAKAFVKNVFINQERKLEVRRRSDTALVVTVNDANQRFGDELTEGHHQEWSMRLNLTQHGKTHPSRTLRGLTDQELFLDSVGSGAWPFLVGGAICLANSDNERDSGLLTSGGIHVSRATPRCAAAEHSRRRLRERSAEHLQCRQPLLRGTSDTFASRTRKSNNRSVMPLDVRGCTRATLTASACVQARPGKARKSVETFS
ncbi:hypothetical protein TTRE_0000982701, partial [Trichuris trichiura]